MRRLYGQFDQDGLTYRAYLPGDHGDPLRWDLQVMDHDGILREIYVPMSDYPFLYPEREDQLLLQHAIDQLIREFRERN